MYNDPSNKQLSTILESFQSLLSITLQRRPLDDVHDPLKLLIGAHHCPIIKKPTIEFQGGDLSFDPVNDGLQDQGEEETCQGSP